MVFASYSFVFAFLPTTLMLFYWLRYAGASPDAQKLALIAASLFFYGFNVPIYLLLIISSIAVSYICGAAICSAGDDTALRRAAFVIGVIFNIALLGWFKYRDFFADNINALFGTSIPLAHIALPLGISFFTFQQITFLKTLYESRGICPPPRSITRSSCCSFRSS